MHRDWSRWQGVTIALREDGLAVMRAKVSADGSVYEASVSSYETAGKVPVFNDLEEALAQLCRELAFLAKPAVQKAFRQLEDTEEYLTQQSADLTQDEQDEMRRRMAREIMARLHAGEFGPFEMPPGQWLDTD